MLSLSQSVKCKVFITTMQASEIVGLFQVIGPQNHHIEKGKMTRPDSRPLTNIMNGQMIEKKVVGHLPQGGAQVRGLLMIMMP